MRPMRVRQALEKNSPLMTRPVPMTQPRTQCAGSRLAQRAPTQPPAVAKAIIQIAWGHTMAPATAKAATDSKDSTKELRFFNALTVFKRPSPCPLYTSYAAGE